MLALTTVATTIVDCDKSFTYILSRTPPSSLFEAGDVSIFPMRKLRPPKGTRSVAGGSTGPGLRPADGAGLARETNGVAYHSGAG